MIKIDNITKVFQLTKEQKKEEGSKYSGKSLEVIKGVSFECQPGRVFTLLGPNGAGKTTTLRMIATMLKPSSGTIEVNGYDAVKNPIEVKKSIGFLTGSTGLYHRLTPNEVVKYFADLHYMDKAEFEERKDKYFKMLGIDKFADRKIDKLSTGMKQKVSIVRTIIHNPPVVVFDEPTSGLDIIAARNIIQLIRDCREEGKTIIFSTHRMDEVSLLSDDLAIISDGELKYNGTFDEFKAQMQSDCLESEFIRIVG